MHGPFGWVRLLALYRLKILLKVAVWEGAAGKSGGRHNPMNKKR
jgi:hypothetical protein